MTTAAAELIDEIGFDRLSMGLVAQRLGVKTPSLYKHVASQADLAHLIAVLAGNELADSIRDATQGRAGREALVAGAQAMRAYAHEHPGRYATANAARVTQPDDALATAGARVLASWSAMLQGYRLDPAHEVHALRTLRSMMHGFAVLEAADSFQIEEDVEASFTWMIDLLDHGLQSMRAPD